MLRKMFLVFAEYLARHPSPMPAPQQPKATTPSRAKKQKQHVTKQKTQQHPHNKWVRLKRKMEDGDFTRRSLIGKIATFLQSVLPNGGTPSAQQSMPLPITPTVQTGVHPEGIDTASPLYHSYPAHTKVYLHHQ